MGKKSPPRKFSPLYQKASWVLFSIIVIVQGVLDLVQYKSDQAGSLSSFLFHLSLMLVIGWAIYKFWQKSSAPRPPYLGIAFALGAVNEIIANVLVLRLLDSELFGSVFFFVLGPIMDTLGGVGDILSMIIIYALLTFIVPLLLLKWVTQGDWKKTIILALKIVGVAIVAEIVLSTIFISLTLRL